MASDYQSEGSWATAVLITIQANKLAALILAPSFACFLWFFVSYHTSPLKRYPGPFLDGWTNLWRLWVVYRADYAHTVKKLHEKYGPVVRLGPNLLDLDLPELSRVVYSTDGKWRKTTMYQNSSSIINGKITYHMFSEIDNAEHARMKRPVVRHYSVPSVLAMEALQDQVIDEFLQHLQKRFVEPGATCEFGEWLGYYGWDFLGVVTFSKKFGYMERGTDFDGTLSIGDQAIDYFGMCGQMPWLDHWLDKNPAYPLGPPNLSNVTRIAVANLTARLKGEDKAFRPERPDFLQYFIESKESHPDVVDEGQIIGYLLLNLIAGADTTAITMRALFYHTPWCGETLRFHPAVSMTMERVVPAPGLALPDGSVVPAGSHVGMNPYIVGRNGGIFGPDADEFNPDRWQQRADETDDAFKDRMQLWNTANLVFGGESRICLGRNLSMMEVYKLVPTLIATFDIALADPDEKWWTSSRWFYRTKGRGL
ncbi:cytochrome P450 [Podospora appendiculata]|uniref:Cytochrome P450 n=1 Tax=Podospora appendiculata TaxID=314037 RepID=A0AAE1CHA0_9PEZI|nr:cytochrome P450 [Podospora appendiculata]